MGVFDFVKKMATGASDEDNRKNKARMREIFNSLVPNGDDYKLIYCHMEDTMPLLWRSTCTAIILSDISREK